MGPIVCIIIGAGLAQALTASRAASAYRAGVQDSLDTAAATAEGARIAQGYALSLDPVQAIASVTDQSLALAEVSRANIRELDRRASALPLFTRISGMGAAMPPAAVAEAIVTFAESARRISPPRSYVDRALATMPGRSNARVRWYREYREARPVRQWDMVEAKLEDRDARKNIRLRSWILERLAILEAAARNRLERENLPPHIARATHSTLRRIGEYFASVSGTSWPADDATIHAELLEIARRIAPPGVDVPRNMRAVEGSVPAERIARRLQRARLRARLDGDGRDDRRAKRARRRKRMRTVGTALVAAANPVAGGALIAAQALGRRAKKRRAARAAARRRRAVAGGAELRATSPRRRRAAARALAAANPIAAGRMIARARKRRRAARARAQMGALLLPQSFGAGFV